MLNAQMGDDEWRECLERMVERAESWKISPLQAFERIAALLKSEHFGIEYATLDNTDDDSSAPSMQFLNMGESYATTLVLTDDYTNGVKLLVTSWGDWYEEQEQHYENENGVVRCGYCSAFTPFEYGVNAWHSHTCENCGNCVSG